jgi:hypothetical protein
MADVARPLVRYKLIVYAPLIFVAFPNHPDDLPPGEYRKHLPLFAREFGVLVEDHLADFFKVVDECDVEYEDVVMRMFVQTLEGDAQVWYKSLPDASIDGWDSFQEKFTERWVDKQDNSFLLKAFANLKKNENETVTEFNAHFSKAYYRIPTAIRHDDTLALMYYLETYDGILDIFLGNKDLHNLEEAQVVAIKLERNICASYKFPLIHVPDQPGKVTPFNDIQPSVVTRAQDPCY